MAAIRDVSITIGDKSFVVKPNFKGISAIETVTGLGMIELMQAISAVRTNMVATVIFHAIRANDHEIEFDEVGDAVVSSLGVKGNPLGKAAADYLAAFFPKVDAGKKSPAASGKTTG